MYTTHTLVQDWTNDATSVPFNSGGDATWSKNHKFIYFSIVT